eukprot:CAMPEP_0115121012 /NCGR_PEP_ID=MMETSP0227-20121206/46015_1 /TAXON_ID=89957 /ORGANISM="Polarella glacialis, Strain CCMP 1383" /LENGTH=449 /DNA_ID=CAMNT_0002522755 /DNA_START=86 /DNA_END=1435 /DNA_ORIENTATION=+
MAAAPSEEQNAAAAPTTTSATATPTTTATAAAASEEQKRKEPETPTLKATKPAEPEAKRLKANPPDPAVVRKQVEYYLSDENLKYDKFFSEKIASDKEGWLDITLILSCNKMKLIRATKDDIVASLKDSKIELKEGGGFVRRPGNFALPLLEARAPHGGKKNSIHAHDGGVVAIFKGIPEEQQWTQIKAAVAEKLPAKVNLWFVSQVSDKNDCMLACAPFEGDIVFFEGLVVEVGGAKLKSEVCFGELLQNALKTMPKHIRDKRDRESRKRQKERNRPIKVGTSHFNNVAMLRGRVKEILNSRSDGEVLKPDGSDFKLIKCLLEFHPKGKDKSEGLTGIKVQKSSQGDSRCFYMIKENGVEEDFSAKKCLDAVELNPPYVAVEEKAKPAAPAAAAKAPEGAKAADAPAVAPAVAAAVAPAVAAAVAPAVAPAEKAAEKAVEPAAEKAAA